MKTLDDTAVTTSGQRGPYAKTAAQRERILRAALEFFGQYGYYGASMRELARHLDMSQAGLLHHFPSKTDLLIAVLEARDHLPIASEPSGSATVLDLLIGLVERNARERNLVRLFATLSAEATTDDHPAHEYFKDRYVRLSKVLATGYEDSISSGVVIDVEPDVWARRTLALMSGLQLQWLLDERIDMVRLFRDYLDGFRVPSTPKRERRR